MKEAMYGLEGLLAGRTLGTRYRVEAVIGRGGMGAVYRGHDLRLGREVALKVVSVPVPDPETHRRLRSRFHREARAAAALRHPNVVAIHDFGTDPELDLDFLVMELLSGEDLASRLRRQEPVSTSTALSIFYQAARGLAAGHRAGLVHRDVKPGNLFLEPGERGGDVRVKVLDFGIAEITAGDEATLTQLTVAGHSPYSPAFASPEQLRGEARLSPATDVFSLGATLYLLLTGQRVFHSVEFRELNRELSQTLDTLAAGECAIPAPLRSVLQRALAPLPQDRFADADALSVELEPLLADHGSDWRTGGGEPVYDDTPPPVTLMDAGPVSPPETYAQSYAPPTYVEQEVARPSYEAEAPRAEPVGWLRRTAVVAWRLLITTTATVLFVGAWGVIIWSLARGDLTSVYLAVGASVLLAPLVAYRLFGGGGSLRAAMLTSVIGSLLTIYFLGREQRIEIVLGSLFLAQVGLALAAERITRRAG